MSKGKPLSPEERATRTKRQCVQNINRSMRFDAGGKNKIQYIIDKTGCDPEMAKKIADLVDHQIEGIRKRTSHDREELMRRFEDDDIIEQAQTKCEWKPKSLVILGFKDVHSASNFYDSSSFGAYPGIYGAQFHKDAAPFLLLQKHGRIVLED